MGGEAGGKQQLQAKREGVGAAGAGGLVVEQRKLVGEQVIDAGAEIMRVCADAGGTLTGEHGIGMEKKDLMPLIFSQDDVDVMLRVKMAADPSGLCNPGKMFPTAGRCLELFSRRGRAVGW